MSLTTVRHVFLVGNMSTVGVVFRGMFMHGFVSSMFVLAFGVMSYMTAVLVTCWTFFDFTSASTSKA